MPLYSVLVACVLFLLATNSIASDLFDVLQRMSAADSKQNYQGIFILRKSDKLSTLRVTHGSDEKGTWESLEALNGEPGIVIRRNNKLISIFPGRELITVQHNAELQPLHPQLPENISQLELLYSINQQADDRIANHQALVVDLVPKDKLRYGYRYWIDRDTGILLRCDLVAENNTVIEQMMFTSLDYLAQTPARAYDLEQYKHYRKLPLEEAGSGTARSDVSEELPLRWIVNTLPKGFQLTQSTMRNRQSSVHENGQQDLLHLVYSDGLASVSVFIEKNLGSDKHLQGASTVGAMNAFGLPVNGHFVTVVGEVPAKTVQSMAQSTVKIKDK